MKVVLIGIGCSAHSGIGRALSSMVYGIPVPDPATFAGVVAALAIIEFTACFIPARRAAKVDPRVALRCE
jgi:putative ABC transport system permease protein